MTRILSLVTLAWLSGQSAELEVRFIGNAGVQLSDGATTLLIDLPYQSGAFGYMRYQPATLQPAGNVVSVITHDHDDHFDPGLFGATDWRVVAPPSVTQGLPASRALPGDSLQIGAFSVIAVATPHTPDHRSYRIRWSGRVLYFTGDTEDGAAVTSQPDLDVLFITPWLSCTVERAGGTLPAARIVVYHQFPDGRDQVCASAEPLRQGTGFRLTPAR